MFGMGKKKKKVEKIEDLDCPKPPKQEKQEEQVKSTTVEAKILSEDKSKLLQWLAAEYKDQYAGIFTDQDLEDIDADATSLSMLFAIYGEIRILRMLKEKELLAHK